LTDAAGSEVGVPARADAGVNARLEWTSVPRWPPSELPAAASYLACWFGDAARTRTRELLAGADPRVPVRMAGFAAVWDAGAEAELRRLMSDCVTGARIVLAGPESIVMRAMAVARQFGAATDELVPVAIEAAGPAGPAGPPGPAGRAGAEHPTAAEDIHRGYVSGVAGRRVFCAACRRSFDAVAAIGGIVACTGCAAELIVDYRFSRPHAAYFGWPAGLDLHR